MFDLDVSQVQAIAEQATWVSLAVGFTTGLIFSFNPVALAAIPVSLAYVTKSREQRLAVHYAAAFVVGMILVHVVLGAIAGFGGMWVQKLLGRYWGLVLGPLVIVLGLSWAGWVRLPLPQIAIRARRATTMWGAGALGAAFAVAICPFCTPALVVLLGVAAGLGSVFYGVVLLLAFALGRALPILLGGWALGALESMKPLGQYQRAFEVVGAVVLILMGLYMLNAFFIVIPQLAA
jgi:cytochrome c-type biogenesis protein